MKDEFCLDLLMHHKVHISWKNDSSFPSSHHKDFHFRLTRQDFSKLMKEMKTNKTLLAFWLLRTRSVIKTTRSKICCKLSTQNSNINVVIVKKAFTFCKIKLYSTNFTESSKKYTQYLHFLPPPKALNSSKTPTKTSQDKRRTVNWLILTSFLNLCHFLYFLRTGFLYKFPQAHDICGKILRKGETLEMLIGLSPHSDGSTSKMKGLGDKSK